MWCRLLRVVFVHTAIWLSSFLDLHDLRLPKHFLPYYCTMPKKKLRSLHRLFCFLFDGVAGAMGGRKAVRLDLVRCLSCPPLHPRGGTGHGDHGAHDLGRGCPKTLQWGHLATHDDPGWPRSAKGREGMELKSQVDIQFPMVPWWWSPSNDRNYGGLRCTLWSHLDVLVRIFISCFQPKLSWTSMCPFARTQQDYVLSTSKKEMTYYTDMFRFCWGITYGPGVF